MDDLTSAAPDEVQATTAEQQGPPAADPPRLDENMQAFDDADPLMLAATTLTGDLRDFVLNLLDVHRSPQPMKRRPESEQRKIIAEVTARCREMVEEACRIIATQGGATLTGTLEKVDVKGAIKATITLSKADPARHALFDAQGGDVMVALIDSRRFHGERAPAVVTPDQSDIETYAEEVNKANDNARGDDGEVHLVPPEDVPGAMGGDEAADPARPWGGDAEEPEGESLGGPFGEPPAEGALAVAPPKRRGGGRRRAAESDARH